MSNFKILTLNAAQDCRGLARISKENRKTCSFGADLNRLTFQSFLIIFFATMMHLNANGSNSNIVAASNMDACFECHAAINVDLDADCEFHVNASHLLIDLMGADESHFSIELSFANGLIIADNVLRLQHVGQNIVAKVSYLGGGLCTQGYQCQTKINLGHSSTVGMTGTPKATVYCTDPFLQLDPASADYPFKPTISVGCGGGATGPFFAGDWVMLNACMTSGDTVKTIMRQWWAESKEGERRTITDTIKVLLLPALSIDNFYCGAMDTVYCNDTIEQVGPYIVLPGLSPGACDTLFLMDGNRKPREFDASCGIGVQLDSLVFEASGCVQITEYTLQVHQSCFGAAGGMCTVSGSDVEIVVSPGVNLASCSFWLVNLDTLPPVASCDLSGYGVVDTIEGKLTFEVAAGSDCYAKMILPPVNAKDQCNGVSFVKATIDTLGTYIYTYNSFSDQWITGATEALLARTKPYTIYIEAGDDCGNVTLDSCAVIVSDLTNPIVLTHLTLNFPLTGPLSWIDYTMVDDHSYDNCGIEYLLVRRTDWQQNWAGFCDSITFYLDNMAMDSIWEKFIESDLSLNEFESYYANVLSDFTMAPSVAGTLVNEAWLYDLRRYATVDCLGKLTLDAFNTIYTALHPHLDLAELVAIGGGWAPKAPFTCADACQTVKIELLAIDSSGNWSTGWSDVFVEDKMDPTIAQELRSDVAMSCTAYNQDQGYRTTGMVADVALSEIVTLASAGNNDALILLDSLFGGYQVGYLSGADYIDVDGKIISDVLFKDRGGCKCVDETREIRYYDFTMEAFVTKDSAITVCLRDTADLPAIKNGVVAANCVQNTQILQTVTADITECGGTITRTFTMTNTCAGASPVGVVKTQTITIGDTCTLTKWMFDLPADTLIYACKPEFDDDGNIIGGADPSVTGEPIYLFDFDCRIIGLARNDNTMTPGGDIGCTLIRRTWYFGDWCVATEIADWWMDQSVVADSFTQIIIIEDNLAPGCALDVMGKDEDGFVDAGPGCDLGLTVTFNATDDCGIKNVRIFLDSLDGGDSFQKGFLPLNAFGATTYSFEVPAFTINGPGLYRAVVIATDLCGNDTTCIDTFTIDCSLSRQSGLADIGMDQMPVSKDPLVMDDIINASSPIILDESQSTGGEGFVLYQNRPNPFSNITIVGFDLPEVDEIRLTVYDTKGQRLKTVEGRYSTGHHEIELDFGAFNASGVLYYQLDTRQYSATRRMIVTP